MQETPWDAYLTTVLGHPLQMVVHKDVSIAPDNSSELFRRSMRWGQPFFDSSQLLVAHGAWVSLPTDCTSSCVSVPLPRGNWDLLGSVQLTLDVPREFDTDDIRAWLHNGLQLPLHATRVREQPSSVSLSAPPSSPSRNLRTIVVDMEVLSLPLFPLLCFTGVSTLAVNLPVGLIRGCRAFLAVVSTLHLRSAFARREFVWPTRAGCLTLRHGSARLDPVLGGPTTAELSVMQLNRTASVPEPTTEPTTEPPGPIACMSVTAHALTDAAVYLQVDLSSAESLHRLVHDVLGEIGVVLSPLQYDFTAHTMQTPLSRERAAAVCTYLARAMAVRNVHVALRGWLRR